MDQRILQILSEYPRRGRRGVFPHLVRDLLGVEVHVVTVRRRMRRLWLDGQLERIGGENARRGYLVA